MLNGGARDGAPIGPACPDLVAAPRRPDSKLDCSTTASEELGTAPGLVSRAEAAAPAPGTALAPLMGAGRATLASAGWGTSAVPGTRTASPLPFRATSTHLRSACVAGAASAAAVVPDDSVPGAVPGAMSRSKPDSRLASAVESAEGCELNGTCQGSDHERRGLGEGRGSRATSAAAPPSALASACDVRSGQACTLPDVASRVSKVPCEHWSSHAISHLPVGRNQTQSGAITHL